MPKYGCALSQDVVLLFVRIKQTRYDALMSELSRCLQVDFLKFGLRKAISFHSLCRATITAAS